MPDKDDYLEGTTLQLDLWGDHLVTLEERLDHGPPRGRDALRSRIGELRRKKRSLKRNLRAAVYDEGQRWTEARADIESEVRDFRRLAAEVYDKVRRVS